MANILIDCETAFEAVEDAYVEYKEVLNVYKKNGSEAAALCQEIISRITGEKCNDIDEIKRIEKSLSDDNPRVQLEKINKQLAEADKIQKPENDAVYWLRQYQGVGGALHDSDRKKLEKKREQLERESALYPAEPGEHELFNLKKKTYEATGDEREKLTESEQKVKSAYQAVCDRRSDVHEALKKLHEVVNRLDNEVGAFATGNMQSNYNDVLLSINKLRRGSY